MAIKTSNSGTEFEKAPEGMHAARCFKLIDCGTHLDEKWQKSKRIGWVFFELPNALMSPDDHGKQRPFVIGKRYTLSHNEKALLRIDLESWYGKTFNTADLDKAGGFDLEKLLGRPAMLNVVHSEDGKYANIKSVNPMPQGMECPPAVNPTFSFSIDEVTTEKFEQLSEKMQQFVKDSQECKGKPKMATAATADNFDDDIPF
jgi:hypothetical protein